MKLQWVLASCLITLLTACHGGGGTTSQPPTPPPPPVTPVVPVLKTVSTLTKDIPNIDTLVADSAGNLFATSEVKNRIYKIAPDGTATVFAGSSTGVSGFQNATGTAALFSFPAGMAIDSADNLYVADYANHAIRKITPAGVVTTLAGNGTEGYADGTGDVARFKSPVGMAFDGAGALYVADGSNCRIRKVTLGGVVTTVAGSGTAGNADGLGTAASFSRPFGIAVVGGTTLYVTDFGSHVIRKITSDGTVTTLAGSPLVAGEVDGTGTAARFNRPACLSADEVGNLYVPDWGGNTIRKVTPAGEVTTVVGTADLPGYVDGTTSIALIASPYGVLVRRTAPGEAKLYVADRAYGRVRVVDGRAPILPTLGTVSTVATGITGMDDVVVDSAGNRFASSESNHCIYKIAPDGTVSVFAGASGTPGYANGTGSAARFEMPAGLAIDGANNLYVAEYGNHAIRKITPAGVVTTLAGTGTAGYVDGANASARFSNPVGIACTDNGTLYVTERTNRRVRKIDSGTVTTLAGSGASGNADGVGTAASFTYPFGIAVYGSSPLYVTDFSSHLIRRIDRQTGAVTTLAGQAGVLGHADGIGAAATFGKPALPSLDQAGNLLVPEIGNHILRKVTPTGQVSLVAGVPGTSGSSNGPAVSATFSGPFSARVSGTKLYVADNDNGALRKVE